jgi:hypothetical protein
MLTNELNMSDIDIRVLRTEALTDYDLKMVHRLFDLSYHRANHKYLEKSFSKLRYIALATSKETPAGFALADTIETRLPRLAYPQVVMLAGICCIAPDCRRMGLFTKLEILAANANGLLKSGIRILMCGRMAHPVSFRTIRKSPHVIPKYGVPLSDWHKEIGLRVAGLYGVTLDPETFIVKGDGLPIGYPDLEYEIPEEEWLPFQAVNRDQGDSLLGMTWFPDAPEGW